MITLDEHLIRLQSKAVDKQDAIRQAGQLLVDNGYIDAGYVTSMLGREGVANTYLGNGISIPHGLPKDRDLIKQTGISVVQVPGGVTWNPGETAHLVVGIAAKSDEHIDVLRRLTRVLGDEEQVARLTRTTDPRDIIEALTGERPAAPVKKADATDYADFFDAVILNKTGLHARPAATFVDVAKRFQADVRVRRDGNVANGKSLLSLLQLGVEHGTTIRVSAQGADALASLNALKAAIAVGLGDEPEEQLPPVPGASTQGWVPQAAVTTIAGIPASGGLAIGPIRQYTHRPIVVTDQPGDPVAEGNKLQNALNAAQAELDRLHEEVKTRLGSGKAAIFRVHAEFLNDASLIMQTISLIYQGHSAAWAWQQIIGVRVSQMQKLDDPILAGRAVDLSDVGQRVLRHLVGTGEEQPISLDTPTILIAEDLTPSDTATLDPDMILGLCTAKGGPTSHTAILARGFGLPAVVGLGDSVLDVADGTPGILDGESGKLYLKPSEADVQAARNLQQQLQRLQDAANATRFTSATTTDGYRVEVAANINRAADAPQAIEAGAEGVGLIRTEFLFLARDSAPTEEEQFEAYKAMAQAMGGRPLIIRTLDIGGDKEVPYLHLPKEDNSFLGVRGIRLCLIRPDLFIPQLRAIYRAAAYGRILIMLPMVSTLEDVERARAIAEQVRQELNAPALPLGIMIEVPSAVILADHFAQEVDFFSIGTNDLTQYTLAMDRLHPQLARQADALHPAVLRMIEKTVQAARKAGKWVGVCGGIAGDPKGAVILTGLGVSELSVSIPSIAAVKAEIRSHSLTEMQEVAQKALQCRTAAEVRSL
ncbi:MAG TPA: phosphoenolpyruvate--protein phosphotransferase [Ktedonobacteraceae bacterium]|nr:phosphoenolpyruvate--protein phosphotransferase [Ktedonobacteraceae bacterium]